MREEDPAGEANPLQLKYDKEFYIATATDRFSENWKTGTTTVSRFAEKLKRTIRTHETLEEYKALAKPQQDNIKDIGGYVGGPLKGGRRLKEAVQTRHILTFDVDHGFPKTIDRVKKVLKSYCYTISSSHKHTPEKPRFRLTVYPDRLMTVDEYEPVARKIAEAIDIEAFDPASYKINSMMYWSSASLDGIFLHEHNDAPFLEVDKVLAKYGEGNAWEDFSLWPRSSKETGTFSRMLKKLGDPRQKKGIIGAYCRVFFPIQKAIDAELGDVYAKARDDRYTYIEGTSSSGLVIYDGMLAYSNHQSDPAATGHAHSAWDLVRIHKFGNLDAEVNPATPINRMPSSEAMTEWAREIPEVRAELIESRLEVDAESFDRPEFTDTPDRKWRNELQTTENGAVKKAMFNVGLIVENDPKLKDRVKFNEFTRRMENSKTGGMFENKDLHDIRMYIGRVYVADFNKKDVADALYAQSKTNIYNPVRDYFEGLVWDGESRLETLFIEYFGCKDDLYTREIPRKTLVGAVTRVYEPGCKFDNVMVFDGAQGIGKTQFVYILAHGDKWYRELLTTSDRQKAVEQISGGLLVEMSELSATKTNKIEEEKAFISAREDRYRPPYALYTEEFKRQCIFIGTTNLREYLKDSTGNRRYWPITCNTKLDFDKFKANVDQIWAEAVVLYKAEYGVVLSPEVEIMAQQEQEGRFDQDSWEPIINEWLETDAPVARYDEVDYNDYTVENMEPRNRVCVFEIYRDCLKMKGQPDRRESKKIGYILNRNWEWKKTTVQRFGKLGRAKGWNRIPLNELF